MHLYIMPLETAKKREVSLETLRQENKAEIFDTRAFHVTPVYTRHEQEIYAIDSNHSVFVFIDDDSLFEKEIPETIDKQQQWKKITNDKTVASLVVRKAGLITSR